MDNFMTQMHKRPAFLPGAYGRIAATLEALGMFTSAHSMVCLTVRDFEVAANGITNIVSTDTTWTSQIMMQKDLIVYSENKAWYLMIFMSSITSIYVTFVGL